MHICFIQLFASAIFTEVTPSTPGYELLTEAREQQIIVVLLLAA